MHYLQGAFRSLGPENATNAAIRFVLDIIFTDHMFDELLCTLTDKSRYGGCSGEPDWDLARKNSNIPAGSLKDKDWPSNADFCAYVEYPNTKTYLTRAELYTYINQIMKVFLEHDPAHRALVQPLIDFMQSGKITSEAGNKACDTM